MLNESDNIAVALEELKAGQLVRVSGNAELFDVTVRDDIGFGHKLAVLYIKTGTDVIKYGEIIGTAKADIEVGERVHCHNIAGTPRI